MLAALEQDLWNLVLEQEPEKKLLKKDTTWQDAMKATAAVVESLENDGWDLDAQGYTMPLFVCEGSSDKEYHINLHQSSEGLWNLTCQYGRRGSALKSTVKATNKTLSEAWKEFRTVIADQLKKGYQFYVEGVDYQVGVRSEKVPGLKIQLLTEAQDLIALINDDTYFMQEKFDGERRPVIKTIEGVVVGTNKEGVSVSLNKVFEKAINELPVNSVKFDCEDLGGLLVIFDILELDGKDLSEVSALERISILEHVLSKTSSNCLLVASAHKTKEEKSQKVRELMARNAEGVVFKKKDVGYTHGTNLEGTQQKFKFYAEASVIVCAQNQKRSVQMGVMQKDQLILIGNVTIPANANIPSVGDIIEVRYLYAYKGGCLFHTTYKGLRNDQKREGCTIEKLKYKSDYMYAEELKTQFLKEA